LEQNPKKTPKNFFIYRMNKATRDLESDVIGNYCGFGDLGSDYCAAGCKVYAFEALSGFSNPAVVALMLSLVITLDKTSAARLLAEGFVGYWGP
jgi:acyl CoA:acetate/3-ketoacid CoA transferase alpha subunit